MDKIAKVLVADCHVRGGWEKESRFRAMLAGLSALPQECQVIFLGDIFDLWIALDAYEDALHKDFLQWCKKEKDRREVIFIEGNHELYVKRRYAESFTFVSEREYVEGNTCFCHGDQFNSRDPGYKIFRFILRNSVMYFLAYLTGHSLGPLVAKLVKRIFRCKGKKEARPLPEKVLERFTGKLKKRGLTSAVAGHFHRESLFSGKNGCVIRLVPAWEVSGQIGVVFSDGRYVNMDWENLPKGGKKEGNSL